MESIAVTKPNMGVLPRERLALSPFGALAQAFSEELLARTERVEGRWPYLPLDFLEEGEPPALPPAAPVYQVDLHLVLEALRREKGEREGQKAAERIVERVLRIRESRPARPQAEQGQPAVPAAKAPPPGVLIQNFHQMILRQENRFSLPRPAARGEGTETERAASSPWRALPGGLGRRSVDFSQALRQLREEGREQPPAPAEGERRTELRRPARRVESPAAQAELEHLAEAAGTRETPEGSAAAAAGARLEQAAEAAVRHALEQVWPAAPARTEGGKSSPAQAARPAGRADHPGTGREREASPAPAGERTRPAGGKQGAPGETERPAENISLTAARDIRVAGQAETPSAVGGSAAGQSPGTVPEAGEVHQLPPVPGVELAHRTEEERPAPPGAGEELARRGEQVRPAAPARTEGGKAAPAQAARPAGRADRPETGREREASPAPAGERTRPAGGKQGAPDEAEHPAEHISLTAARDIRVAGRGETPSAVGVSAAGQSPDTVPEAGEVHLPPVPGVELAHRTEEEPSALPGAGEEPPRRMEQARPAAPARTEGGKAAPAQTARSTGGKQGAPGEAEHPAEHISLTAARDIRVAGRGETPSAVGVSAAGQSPNMVPKPGEVHLPPVPGVELAHRTEEEPSAPPGAGEEPARRMEQARPAAPARTEGGKSSPAQAARPAGRADRPGTGREREVSPAPAGERVRPAGGKQGAPGEAEHPAGNISLTAARDIRVAGRGETPSTVGVSAAGQSPNTVPEAGEVHLPPVPGVELAHRTEEEPSAPPGAGEEPARRMEQARPAAPARTEGGKSSPAQAARPAGGKQGAPGEAEHPAENISLTAARDIRVGNHIRPARGRAARRPAAGMEPAELFTLRPEHMAAGETAGLTPGAGQRPLPPRSGGPQSRQGPSGAAETAAQVPDRVELTYAPAQPAAEPPRREPPAQPRQAEESEFVRSLPDWARRFLRENSGQGAASQPGMGVARDISTLPGTAEGEAAVQWTAPGYRPPAAPITHREHPRAEGQARQQPSPRISEAELQRTADRVYRMIEDRIRKERRRLGL